jgi:hypothetical protein
VAARFLIHARASTLAPSFDAMLRGEGVRAAPTPYRAPTANAVAERRVGPARRECLDHLLIADEGRPQRGLATFVRHCSEARPQKGSGQATPAPVPGAGERGPVGRRDVQGGLMREYYREAASRGGRCFSTAQSVFVNAIPLAHADGAASARSSAPRASSADRCASVTPVRPVMSSRS